MKIEIVDKRGKITEFSGHINVQSVDKSCRGIKKAIKAAIKAAAPYSRAEIVDIKTKEGAEACGSGPLDVTATVRYMPRARQFQNFVLVVAENRSKWRNYGAPHGTLYSYDFDLVIPSR